MTWDSVPWFVGGGAEHSPEVARLLAYAATNASEGIVSAGDLKVTPLDVPTSKVRALAGAAIILCESAGGAQQTYVGRNVSEDVVSISATGAGSGRSDLIVARVEDPWMAGEPWNDPANAKVGPYIFTRVIPNVSSTATAAPAGSSAIALARIDIPANTSVITAGMVKDLRKLAQPRESRVVNQAMPAPGNALMSTSFINWPGSQGWPIYVPTWATHFYMTYTMSGVQVEGGDAWGQLRGVFGDVTGANLEYDYDLTGGDPSRTEFAVNVNATCSHLRGQTVYAKLQGLRYDAAGNPGHLITRPMSHELLDIQFYERAV